MAGRNSYSTCKRRERPPLAAPFISDYAFVNAGQNSAGPLFIM